MAMEHIVAYMYEKLAADKQEIRLLEVYPGTPGDELICKVRRVKLSDCPDYDTISYVWGDIADRRTIYNDGAQMSVPASTAAALRAARLTDTPRMLWIDAICIDQNNVEERSHQVALMREIYSNGGTNLICLGHSDTAAEEFSEMYKIVEEARDATKNFALLETTVLDSNGQLRGPEESLQETTHVRWIKLSRLFNRPWFRRVWVMQEAALAKNNLCLYGNVSVPLLDILRALVWIYHRGWNIGINAPLIPSITILWQLVDQEYSSNSRECYQRGLSATSCLYLGRSLDVTDSKDRVFGMLGLMKLENVPQELEPDYHKSVRDVFRDATRYALQEGEGYCTDMIFDMISHRSQEEVDDPDWLSWVPRWDRNFKTAEGDAAVLRPIFNAHDGENIRCFDSEPDFLAYGGVCVGRVKRSFPKNDQAFAMDDIPELKEFSTWFREAKTQSKTNSITLGNTLLAGAKWKGERLTERDEMAFLGLERHIFLQDDLPADRHSEVEREASQFWMASTSACRNRRLVELEDGSLALCPRVVQQNDIIAVIYGCQLPYLLRPCGTRFKLLGACYVDGIMDGQAVQMHRAENRPDDYFELC